MKCWLNLLLLAAALLAAGAAQAETCHTYQTQLGSTTYCDDGTTYRTYRDQLGETTIITPGPGNTPRMPNGGDRPRTCHTYRDQLGSTTTCN
jgi:hypothetical protein